MNQDSLAKELFTSENYGWNEMKSCIYRTDKDENVLESLELRLEA